MNQILLAAISTDTKRYLDVGSSQIRHVCNATVCVCDCHTLPADTIFISLFVMSVYLTIAKLLSTEVISKVTEKDRPEYITVKRKN